jgi:hypothetical protein
MEQMFYYNEERLKSRREFRRGTTNESSSS